MGRILSASPFLLIGDHAGRAIPATLEGLQLTNEDRARHIAVDIGVEELGCALSGLLTAPFLRQAYSRLVIDCNRNPARPDSITAMSDGTAIPLNACLDNADRQMRIREILEPYHAAIASALDARRTLGRQTILVSLHSFAPVMDGFERPWEIGVLYDRGETDFALRLLDWLRTQGRTVGVNQPYAMDETDYSVPLHAYPRSLRYVELEVRQDLLTGSAGQIGQIGELLAAALNYSA